MAIPSGSLAHVRMALHSYANPEKAELLKRFFKCGEGEYAAGDRFLGITVPQTRQVAKTFRGLPLNETVELLKSPWHEERLLALVLLTYQFDKGDELQKKRIFDLYLKNKKYINNWDLVDVSAPRIIGRWLLERDTSVLRKLAVSKNLWDRRIAVISTLYFISRSQFKETLEIAEILLRDQHDLIHKAVGWMLREVGKRDLACEERFLKQHYQRMPRTMLRYAIEKFPERKRLAYLRGTVR